MTGEKENRKNIERKQKKISFFTKEDDEKLLRLFTIYNKNWVTIGNFMNKTGKQVRDRFINTLDPNIIRTPWTVEED